MEIAVIVLLLHRDSARNWLSCTGKKAKESLIE